MSTIKHSNVVKCSGFVAGAPSPTIALECGDLGDLSFQIAARSQARRPFRPRDALTIAIDVAAALNALHLRRVAHRDVKPQNVFLFSSHDEGKRMEVALAAPSVLWEPRRVLVKLSDFGVSRQFTSAMTSMIGTPAYMAPELFAGRPYGTEADIFSLGVLLFQLLALRLPFAARSLAEYQALVRTSAPANALDIASNIVGAALQSNPAQRPTARTVLRALQDLGRSYDSAETPSPPPPPPNAPPVFPALPELPRVPLGLEKRTARWLERRSAWRASESETEGLTDRLVDAYLMPEDFLSWLDFEV